MTTQAAKYRSKLTTADLAPTTIAVTIAGVTTQVPVTARMSSNGNPMFHAVGKLAGDGSNPLANRYQVNVMLTLIDDSPEAQAARKASRK